MPSDLHLEPSLYFHGPPAITPEMFRLWRATPALQQRFDVMSAVGRRDYGLWFIAPGSDHRLGSAAVAAARRLLFRGFALPETPPPWPAVSASPASGGAGDIDEWLRAEAASLPLDGGDRDVPIPRVMALLWELRHDLRHHFDLGTDAGRTGYLAWCLTEGIRAGSLPCGLVPAALWEALDRSDPPAPAPENKPPVTRLLRLVAPLYRGPAAAAAAEFPVTRRGVLAVALWVCGPLRRELGWPAASVASVLHWLAAPAPEFDDAFVPLTNLLAGLWSLAADARPPADLRVHEGRVVMRDWAMTAGLAHFGLEAGPRSPPPGAAGRGMAQVPDATGAAPDATVCLVGFRDASSGRGEDLRMSARALAACDYPHCVIDRWPQRAADAPAGSAAVALIHLNADTAFFDYLFLRGLGLAAGYRIGYWAWELAKFPREWLASFAFVDEIWAPTRFTCDAIAPHTDKPVRLMPLAVDLPPPDGRVSRASFGLPERHVVFYYGFDFRSFAARKNPQAAIAAFRRAFPAGTERAVLLLKTIGSAWHRDALAALLSAVADDRRIRVLDADLPRDQVTALIAMSDCFVSLHRSEGFGRGPAEAMLLGKPVIATGYSGTCDFVTADTALPVGYRLVPVRRGEYPGGEGQVWAEPDLDEAAAAMRRIAADPAMAARLGRAGQAEVVRRYAPSVVGRHYAARLREIVAARRTVRSAAY